MKFTLKLIILILFYSTAFAQSFTQTQLDSIYYLYLRTMNYPVDPKLLQTLSIDSIDTKCGFGLINQVVINIDQFSPTQQALIKTLSQRPERDTSFITPSGYFRVHYNLSGTEAPKYDLNELAIALDSSYNFEVNYLGYLPPPSDKGEGGDDKYDVYIVNRGSHGSGDYGYTQFEEEVSPGKYTSFMVIDNDYLGYYSEGIDGARVTVAHEFHHAIQAGSYIWREQDRYFYELSSTAMEEFVFDHVNDYYAYMDDYFRNTIRTFSANNGYNLAIWNIFLKEQFGFDILRRQWEMMPQMRALDAINKSIEEQNSSINLVFNKFGIWTYFTNYRTRSGKYFSEADKYPLVRPLLNPIPNFTPPSMLIKSESKAVANNFINIVNKSEALPDTIVAIVTNSDYVNGISNSSKSFQYDYKLFNYDTAGSVKLTNTYHSIFSTESPAFWITTEIINNYLINEGYSSMPKGDFAFPSPFNYGKHSFIYIPANPGLFPIADLNIYSSSMELVYSASTNIFKQPNGQTMVKWNGKNNNNNKLASGVYLYITKSDNNTTTGKLVIFNE
jgi:hypothetical protein